MNQETWEREFDQQVGRLLSLSQQHNDMLQTSVTPTFQGNLRNYIKSFISIQIQEAKVQARYETIKEGKILIQEAEKQAYEKVMERLPKEKEVWNGRYCQCDGECSGGCGETFNQCLSEVKIKIKELMQ